MKKILNSLPFKLLLGVAVGIVLGLVANEAVMNVVVTIKQVLGQIITFCVPLIVIGFIAFAVGAVAAASMFSHVGQRVDSWLHPFSDEQYNRIGGSWQLVTGIFGMASAVFEVAEDPAFAGVPIRVLPGLSAVQAVAADQATDEQAQAGQDAPEEQTAETTEDEDTEQDAGAKAV